VRTLVVLVALLLATLATLPGCVGNLVGGCPITDDGTDECSEGSTRCAGDDAIERCIGAGPCDAYWAEDECGSGMVCRQTDGRAQCVRP
jgi:hypothetical protein